jgi:signal transduction histidine kinase
VLRGLIDELLFGQRPDPLLAATSVADRVGDDPLLALRAIREALLLPYASISSDGVELAASGTVVTETRRLPLRRGDAVVGEVVVGLRPGTLNLSAEDEQVLRIVGPLLAQTLRAHALARELKESRTAAIAAIEEERRRLRRDLHDGLGPTLSGIAHTAAAARNILVDDPAAADALLQGLRSDAAAAVGEIRRLVYDMRPPALDELGLVAALRQQVSVTHSPAGRPVRVLVEADELPTLPASVEVAAFRIATEAVNNSARHSGADEISLQISQLDDQLVVVVRDAGTSTGPWVPGVGLNSMRERAAEIGGTLEVTSNGNGSLVRALLPLG